MSDNDRLLLWNNAAVSDFQKAIENIIVLVDHVAKEVENEKLRVGASGDMVTD